MRFTFVPAAALGVLLAACADPGAPTATGPLFSRPITFDTLTATLTSGPAKVEIDFRPDTGVLVAREVELQEADDLTDEEEIESAASRIERDTLAAGCSGSIILGPFTVQFDGATTEFESEDEADLTCTQFVEQVQAALAAGHRPTVQAERPAPAEPQAPDATTFAARELKLEGEHDHSGIEINIDADNLLACSTLASAPTGCEGVVRVLGVSFAIVNGVTELESEVEHEDMEDQDFEGLVASVTREGTSCTLGSVTLKDGTVVQIAAETELKNESGDDKQLDDLCAVQEALAAGTDVAADGKGLVTADSPHTIIAAEIEFELDEHDDDSSGHGS